MLQGVDHCSWLSEVLLQHCSAPAGPLQSLPRSQTLVLQLRTLHNIVCSSALRTLYSVLVTLEEEIPCLPLLSSDNLNSSREQRPSDPPCCSQHTEQFAGAGVVRKFCNAAAGVGVDVSTV